MVSSVRARAYRWGRPGPLAGAELRWILRVGAANPPDFARERRMQRCPLSLHRRPPHPPLGSPTTLPAILARHRRRWPSHRLAGLPTGCPPIESSEEGTEDGSESRPHAPADCRHLEKGSPGSWAPRSSWAASIPVSTAGAITARWESFAAATRPYPLPLPGTDPSVKPKTPCPRRKTLEFGHWGVNHGVALRCSTSVRRSPHAEMIATPQSLRAPCGRASIRDLLLGEAPKAAGRARSPSGGPN
jgi:hypothetical protein